MNYYKKRRSDTYWNLITKLFIWNFDKISVFWQRITDTYHLEISLKAVNHTPTPEIRWLLTCQNCQMICKPYCWDKQHANMSPHDRLINSYALLPENNVSFFFVFFFWVFLTPTHRFYHHETFFVWYFWIVTNTFKIYFWDISETSQKKHLFLRYVWARIIESLAGCRTKFLFAVFCKIDALERNAYWFHV